MVDTPSSPSSYPRWWISVWGTAAVAGALLGWLAFGPMVTVVTFLAGFAVGATLWLAVTGSDRAGARGSWAETGWLAGVVCIALPAVTEEVSGALAFWLFVLAVLTSPPATTVFRALRHGFPPDSPRSPRSNDPRPTTAEAHATSAVRRHLDTRVTLQQVRGMSSEELCRAWRRSYLGLEVASPGDELAEVLRVRQMYLDELHRRHPTAIEAWIAAGGRAASGPERFLQPPGSGRAA